jgi:transcriptional regulator with XRE-family HTH domain
VGDRFRKLARQRRLEQGMTIQSVANALGLTAVYVSDIERGNRNAPSPDKARVWANAIGGDPDQFEDAARLDRKVVEIPLEERQADGQRNDFLLALARLWDGLDGDEIRQMDEVLRKRRD